MVCQSSKTLIVPLSPPRTPLYGTSVLQGSLSLVYKSLSIALSPPAPSLSAL